MAKWLKFVCDYDHAHDSRAVTAYKAGQIVYCPTHIAREALARGKAVETVNPRSKPIDAGEGDGRRVYIEDVESPGRATGGMVGPYRSYIAGEIATESFISAKANVNDGE